MSLALALILSGGAARAGEAVEAGQFRWTADVPGFGGFSDLAVLDGGQRLVAVSDHGDIFRADVTRDATGVTGIAIRDRLRPRDSTGAEVTGFRQDIEDLQVGSGGRIYLAFESLARIVGFDAPGMTPHPAHPWDAFRRYWGNEGFETLAALPGGGLLAVVEKPGEGGYPTVILKDGAWSDGPPLPGADGFGASGADLGPDGALYLLERRVSIWSGYTVRVRRYGWTGAEWTGGEVLLQERWSENFEGISLWTDPDGGLRMTLISDDNFAVSETTVLREYRLRD